MLMAAIPRLDAPAAQVHFDFDANGQAVGTANTSGDNLLAGDARRIDAGNKRGGTGRVRSGGLPDADQEGCREYTRHLAEARRHHLGGVAATRALYLAGEDGRGRQLVVFCPELASSPSSVSPSPLSINADSGKSLVKPSPCSDRTRRGKKATLSRASKKSSVNDHGEISSDGGGVTVGKGKGDHEDEVLMPAGGDAAAARGVGEGGSEVAAEASVGSAAMAWLLLYFVWLMDNVADRPYVMLLCAGGAGEDGGGGSGGGGGEGWMAWARFSLLGQMHSLLPRRYRKNLEGLVVFQPTPVLHAFFEFARLFLSPKFYQKVQFCESVTELQERFPRGIVENLPERAVTASTKRHRRQPPSGSSDDPGEGIVGDNNTRDGNRPSPVYVGRTFGGGVQTVQGDENRTPPPLPSPPVQSPFSPSVRVAAWGGGSEAGPRSGGSGGKRRSHRRSLEKRFSSSSTSAGGATSTPSPQRLQQLSPHVRSTSQAIRRSSSGGAISSGSDSRQRAKSEGAGNTATATGISGATSTTGGGAAGVLGPTPGGTRESRSPRIYIRTTASPSALGLALAGQSGFHSVPSTRSAQKISPGRAAAAGMPAGTGGMMGVRVTRHGRDRDSRSSLHRRGSSGGEGSGSGGGGSGRGVSPSSLGGRGVSPLTLARGISPTGVKPLGSSGRRGSSSLHGWAADRPSPRLSPHGTVTPRTAVRNAWGGSPGGSMRSGPQTPGCAHSHSGKFTVDTALVLTPGTVRKTPRGSGTVGGGPGRSRSTLLERAEARAAGGGPKGGSGGGASSNKGSPRLHQPSKSPKSSKPNLRRKNSPKAISKRPADGRNDSSDVHERKYEPTGDSPEARKRFSYINSSSRTHSRRSSRESSVSSSNRSSVNTVDSASLAALEREVVSQSSRVIGCSNSTPPSMPHVTAGKSTCANNPGGSGNGNGNGGGGGGGSGGVFKNSSSGAIAGGGSAGVGGGGSVTTRSESNSGGRNAAALAAAAVAGMVAAAAEEQDAQLLSGKQDRSGMGSAAGLGLGLSPTTWGGSATALSKDIGSAGGGVVGMVSTSTPRGGSGRGHHRTTSSRIGPGIQALLSTVGTAPKAAAAATAEIASTGGGQSKGKGKGKGFDASGASPGLGGGRATRSYRCDAGGMRQALLEHKDSMRRAVAAAAAAASAEAAASGSGGGGGSRVGGGGWGVESGASAAAAGGGVPVRRVVPPDPKGKVFGVPLVEVMRMTPALDVPWVLKRFVGFLSKFGLDSVGLFRLAGDGLDRAQLREALDSGQQVSWDPLEEVEGEPECLVLQGENVNMVAQLLKAFFRELPEPLLPFSAYDKVVAIAKAAGGPGERWVQAMKGILWRIPIANYNTLRFLFDFLRTVAANSGTNRMTSENLAIVWAPNLVRPEDDDPFAILKDLRFQIETVRWMVDCFEQLFDD